jgi:hypothetical protein
MRLGDCSNLLQYLNTGDLLLQPLLQSYLILIILLYKYFCQPLAFTRNWKKRKENAIETDPLRVHDLNAGGDHLIRSAWYLTAVLKTWSLRREARLTLWNVRYNRLIVLFPWINDRRLGMTSWLLWPRRGPISACTRLTATIVDAQVSKDEFPRTFKIWYSLDS